MPTVVTPTRRALLLGAAGVLAAPRIAGAQPAPIRLGILQPVTGALAQDGEYGRLGAEAAINDMRVMVGEIRSSADSMRRSVERMEDGR